MLTCAHTASPGRLPALWKALNPTPSRLPSSSELRNLLTSTAVTSPGTWALEMQLVHMEVPHVGNTRWRLKM